MVALWLLAAYLSGAIPWSVWLGRWLHGVDVRREGDGNPGAINAFRAGGRRLGVAVLALDFLKAFIPVLLAYISLTFTPAQMFGIALMPTVGHAFSLFLRFRGGRGLVTWFGVWAALTLYEVPIVMGMAAALGTLLFKSGEARALIIPVVLISYLLLRHAPSWMLLLAVAQSLIIGVKIGVFYWRQARNT